MRQIGGENDDPLKRIQQEINEVKQRELELRNQLRYDSGLKPQQLSPQPSTGDQQQQQQQINSDDSGVSTTSSSPINGTSANRTLDLDSAATRPHRFVDHNPAPIKPVTPKKTINPTYVRSTSAAAFVFAPRNPKPALPVEYYLKANPVKPCPTSKRSTNPSMLTRTVSTPQLFQSFQPKQQSRGFMQRFIETRGKLSSSAAAAAAAVKLAVDNAPIALSNGSMFISPTAQIAPPVRDSDGKPLRKGFVPVEEKIQKELREMRHREVELKIQRQKSLQYDSNNNLDMDDDEEPEPYNSLEFEGNLRSAKSIEGLDYCPRNSSPSPRFERYQKNQNQERSKLRPALSLAQLCDLDDSAEELVCPNRLIAQFECMIQNTRAAV